MTALKQPRTTRLCVVFAAAMCLAQSIEHANAKTLNVAYPSPSWNTSLPVSTAKQFGLFSAEGLDVRPA